MPPPERADGRCEAFPNARARRAAGLVHDEGEREHEREPDQLTPCLVADEQRQQDEQVMLLRRRRDRDDHRVDRPGEGRVCRDLGHQEHRRHDPRHADGQRSDDERQPSKRRQPPGEQEGGDAGRGHEVGARDPCVPVVGRHVPVREERRHEQRIELRVAVDVHPVYARYERMGARDRDREMFVASRIEVDVVTDLGRELAQYRSQHDPDDAQENTVAT